ncbi:hypothetical protein [Novosphingobium endophyticum]|nr:hypothetical protein [Novosphingobium endophyticum]
MTLVQNAPAANRAARTHADWLRAAVVCGCALALILARAPLPF